METFGERLRRLRTERDLSLDELAARTGVTKAYLWRLETSSGVNPSLDIVHKLASGLGVSPAMLVTQVDSASQDSTDIPASLSEAQHRLGFPASDLDDLARIRFRGGQPLTAEDWMAIYLQLKRATTKGE